MTGEELGFLSIYDNGQQQFNTLQDEQGGYYEDRGKQEKGELMQS